MEWTDQGILLTLRRHGESSVIVTLLTQQHGRHAGLIRGGTGKASRGALQPGNRLLVTWKARLAEHLGLITWDILTPHGTRWLDDPRRLAGLSAACAMAEATLPEQEPIPAAHDGLAALLESLAEDDWPSLYVQWELGLLAELGYGLDLTRCAATGATDHLVYVSPRSGRAVSAAAGEPYHDRLLPLPRFLLAPQPASQTDVLDGLRLTGHFLERRVLAPHGRSLPPARARMVQRLSP